MMRTVSGIATAMVGRNATLIRNQPWRMNSRVWKGVRNSALPVRTHIFTKPPTASRPGLAWSRT